MRTYLKYIFLVLILGLTAISCQKELEPSSRPLFDGEALTLVPRVKSFANQYVTKAENSPYSEEEKKITKLAILVFDNSGNILHIQDENNDTGISKLIVNKSILNTTTRADQLDETTVVMFANISLNDIRKPNGDGTYSPIRNIQSFDELENYSYHLAEKNTETDAVDTDVVITSLNENFKGFPMVGMATDVDLRPTTSPQNAVQVNLKILYAKINFYINVADGTENNPVGNNVPSFVLSGYTVNNVSKVTSYKDLDEGEATASADYAYIKSDNPNSTVTVNSTGTATSSSAEPLKFTFYVAESRYNPKSDADGKIDLSGIYPEDNTVGKEYTWLTNYPYEDVEGYNEETDADKLNGVKYFYDDLIQQYKPNLVNSGGTPKTTGDVATGLATYVTVNGTYTDYRGTAWTVNYKIYLGKDNAHNFHVDRNSEYKNYLTIKGIRNNDSYGNGDVWIDHRVNVSTTDPSKHITITRETLIDSHIEVRPLRVKLTGSGYVAAAIYLPKYPLDEQNRIIDNINTNPTSWGQVTEIRGGANENWIAIENNNGSKNRERLYCSNGKRKYFTTSLIEELHLENNTDGNGILTDNNGNKYIALSDGDCAWIYFDENTSLNTRCASIDVVFYTEDNQKRTETFEVSQFGLIQVGNLKIEKYEEYLHSYDSYDIYSLNTSPTDYTQQGLSWGILSNKDEDGDGLLDGLKLSDRHIVKSVSSGYELLSQRYDYYHANDGDYYIFEKNSDASWSEVDKTMNTGLTFTTRAADKTQMTVIDMATRPTSAYQYCLSKNKFHENVVNDNHQMKVHWYLPDTYEMASIFVNNTTSDSNSDFGKNVYYWSSQPSYTVNNLQVVDENKNYARAVATNGIQADIHRSKQHRIRCIRSDEAIVLDMTERVPDGLGGLLKIPMTVANNGFFNYDNWLIPLQNDSIPYPNKTYKFPAGNTYQKGTDERDDADSEFKGKEEDGTHYYNLNPLDKNNWEGTGEYYTTIHENNWPGLTKYEVRNIELFGYSAICEETSTPKRIVKSKTERSGIQIASMPSNVSSIPLDHNNGSDILNISFNKGGNSKSPEYRYYYEQPGTKKTEWTKEWVVPVYTADPNNGKAQIFKGEKTTRTFATAAREAKEESLKRQGYEITSSKVVQGGSKWLDYHESYYEIVASINKYYYVQAGHWGTEEKTFEGPIAVTNSVDALEMYGGNSFTITAKKGYRIKSIKINYKESNHVGTIVGIGRYLRLIDANESIPERNNQPANMTYSADGDQGWYKWTSSSTENGAKWVTLNLVAYSVTTSLNIFGSSIPSSYSYENAKDATGYTSDFETSIVIDSFEIKVEEVEEEESTTN